MSFAMPPLDEVAAMVREVADEHIMQRFNRVQQRRKADGSLVTDADFAVQEALQQRLAQRWPGIELLGEEMTLEQQTHCLNIKNAPIWVLDPVDGTSNFSHGIEFFSTSLALVVNGDFHLGVVYDPVRKECFTAKRGGGAQCNGVTLNARPNMVEHQRRGIAIIDFKRLPLALSQQLIQQAPYGSQRNFGSCALEWAWLAAGRAHLYLHGRQKVWDLAAGQLILLEAGGRACNFAGDERFLCDSMTHSVIAAASPELFPAWRDWVIDALPDDAAR